MFHDLLRRAGLTAPDAARRIGVSESAVRKWIAGHKPSLSNAVDAAGLFRENEGREILRRWGYDPDAWKPLEGRTTHDPAVANGWRLDTLIREQRNTNLLLTRLLDLTRSLIQPHNDMIELATDMEENT